jgi:hypothetical protein
MKPEQRIAIRAYALWQWLLGNGVVEHAAQRWAVNAFSPTTKPDDATGKHIHHHENPVTAKED